MTDIIKTCALAMLLMPCTATAQNTSSGNGMQNTTFYQMKYRADKLLGQKDLKGAAQLYEKAIKADPKQAEPYAKLGYIYSSFPEKKYKEAACKYLVQFCALSSDEAQIAEAEKKIAEINAYLETAKDEPVAPQQEEPKKPVTQVAEPEPIVPTVAEEIEADTLLSDSLIQAPVKRYITVTEEVVVENPITKEVAIVLEEKQVEAPDDMADTDTDEEEVEEEVISTPASSGKFNPFKHNSANAAPATPNKNKKKPFGNKKPASPAKATPATDDKLRMAYTASNLAATPSAPLYSFRNQPEAPFATELFEQSQEGTELSSGGRWVSTLYNSDTMREMLIMDIDATTKQIKICETSDMLSLQSANPNWKGSFTSKTLENNTLTLKYDYDFKAKDMADMGMFIATMLQPYCGKMVTTNPGSIKKIAGKNPYNVHVNCSVSLKFKTTKTSLHGTMTVKCTATIDNADQVQVLNISLPCTLGRAAATYQGFDLSEVKTIDYAAIDTSFTKRVLAQASPNGDEFNNLGYCYLNGIGIQRDEEKALSCFVNAQKKGNRESYANLYLMYRHGWGGAEKDFLKALEWLAAGRKAHSPSAYTLSADLMLSAPKSNAGTALQWFNTAERANDEYAILRLGQMAQAGEGQDQNKDAAIGYFNRSKHKDAFYEQAKPLIRDKKWSAAFKMLKDGAQFGSMKCMQAIAEMYLSGIGIRPDFRSAKMWKAKIAETKKNEQRGYKHVE